MTLAYIVKLGLTSWKTSIEVQIINDSPLETHGMALTRFLFQDSLGRVRFFEETFLLTDTSIEIILEILFLALNNVDF